MVDFRESDSFDRLFVVFGMAFVCGRSCARRVDNCPVFTDRSVRLSGFELSRAAAGLIVRVVHCPARRGSEVDVLQ